MSAENGWIWCRCDGKDIFLSVGRRNGKREILCLVKYFYWKVWEGKRNLQCKDCPIKDKCSERRKEE